MSYRTALYDRYESTFKRLTSQGVDPAIRTDRLYPFRQWLPANHSAEIADVGCGSGELLLALRGAGYERIQGVDIGAEQVTAARQMNLNVELGDAVSYLGERAHAFDLILACDVLEHLTRDEAFTFLRAVRSALRPAGALLLRLPNAAAPRGSVYQFGDLTHETAYTPGSLRQLCQNVGARSITIREDSPPSNTLKRALRRALWEGLKLSYKAADIVETGAAVEVYTRNLVARVEF